MRDRLKRSGDEGSGATAIEYGLIAVIISITLIAAVDTIGSGSVLGYLRSVVEEIGALI